MPIPNPLPSGIVTPLVTFIGPDGAPDASAMNHLVRFQIENGIHGLLAVGSTGELGNLTLEQRTNTIEIVAEAADGDVPVWAGVIGLGTTEAIASAQDAVAAGADALLTFPPLFFDSSDRELERHFSLIAEAVDVPIVAYDVPPRSRRKIPAAVIASLAASGVLSGVKDSSGDLTAGRLLVEATQGIDGFQPYIGSEITIDAGLLLGFHGIVPGFANILPRQAVDLYERHVAGDVSGAAQSQRCYLDLFKVLQVALPGAGAPAAAVNALKVGAAHMLGLPTPAISEPMLQPTADFAAEVISIVDPLMGTNIR